MKQRSIYKAFSIFLCLTLLQLLSGFPGTLAWAQEKNIPIGEMISRGDVKFEARDKVWKKVEPYYFPVFRGGKIKVEKGSAIISLTKNNQVEVKPNSVLVFEEKDQLRLYQGQVDFRIAPKENLNLQVGNLVVIKSPVLQATKTRVVISPNNEEVIGSLFLHANGAVTIRSLRGNLSVLSQDRKVLAALSPKDSLTVPSFIVEQPASEKNPPVKIAQVGEEEITPEPEVYLGLPAKTWGLVGLAALGGVGALIAAGGGGGGGAQRPVCP